MRSAFVLLAFALLALALAARAPATLLDARIDALSGGRLRLADADGTVWNGSGELRTVPADMALRVAWHVDAAPLMIGRLRGTMSINDGAPAAFAVGSREFEVRDLKLILPAQTLLRVAGVPPIASAGGSVDVNISSLSRRADRLEGSFGIRWHGATLSALSISPALALGDVILDASGQAGALVGTISNSGGDVDLSGSASVGSDASASVRASVRPRAGLDQDRENALKTMLSAITPPDGSGAYQLAWHR